MTREEFIGQAVINLIKDKFNINGVAKRRIKDLDDGSKTAGWLSTDPERQINFSTNRKDWFTIFLHEYCHYLQWKEKKYQNLTSNLWDWIANKKELTDEQIEKACNSFRNMEADNERRVVRLMEENEFGCDIEAYIKAANSYIMFYNYVKKHRTWSNKKPPYNVKTIINKMDGTKIVCNDELPKWYENAVTKHCV